jgi:glutamate:GABA antiporter
LPIFAILIVVPSDKITGIGGLMEAVATVFSVYGPAAPAMLTITAVVFAIVLMTQGSAWMIISDRMQAMAAADGAFFGGFFGRFHPRLGTPVRVNLLSGVVATVFLLVAMQVTGSSASIFGVVLSISISTFLLSYVIAIPAAVRLRTRFPNVARPFRVRTGNTGFRVLGGVCLAWVLLGSWVAVFPGTLERLFGLDYDFNETWGVSQGTFEFFTLGTLAVLGILGAVGYLRGKRVRAEGRDAEPEPVAVEVDPAAGKVPAYLES